MRQGGVIGLPGMAAFIHTTQHGFHYISEPLVRRMDNTGQKSGGAGGFTRFKEFTTQTYNYRMQFSE